MKELDCERGGNCYNRGENRLWDNIMKFLPDKRSCLINVVK